MTKDYLAAKFQTGAGQHPAQPTWNPMYARYEFHTPQGILCVDGDTFSEAEEECKKDHLKLISLFPKRSRDYALEDK